MAQEIEEIQSEILEVKEAASSLSSLEILTTNEQVALDSTSRVSVWRLWVYIFATAAWLQQKIQDLYFIEVKDYVAARQIHTKDWYRSKALAYQQGFELIDDTDLFNNTAATIQEISASKVVKQAAVLKRGNGILLVKVATEEAGDLAPLSEVVLSSFQSYMDLVTDAGTRILSSSRVADDLRLEINIHYDPLILDSTGSRLDNTNETPVLDGLKAFLKSIVFNGELIINDLEGYLQDNVDGVRVADVEFAASKYAQYNYSDSLPSVPNVGVINQTRQAEAGYMRLDEGVSELNYIAYNE